MTAIGHTGEGLLDRDLQLRLLKQLAAYYPHSHVGTWQQLCEDEARLKVNLFYLQEHGLLSTDARVERRFGGGFAYGSSRITHKGLDLLADDGGLSAILGVQVIRLHEETVRQLIEQKILLSTMEEQEKHAMTLRLRELPAESVKHIAMKMLDLGLGKGQDAIDWLARHLL